MNHNKKIITVLNNLLADELIAINQYMVHSEMCKNRGYNKLHIETRMQAMEEMHHAEWMIERIIFFNGSPTVSKLNNTEIGETVSEMISKNNNDELDAVRAYNEAIKLVRELDDQDTVELLTMILKMEEGHVYWAEMQRSQIEQMGLENYLTDQSESSAS